MLNTINSGFAIARRNSVEIFFGTVGNDSGSLWVGNYSQDAAFQMLSKYHLDMGKITNHSYIMDRCKTKNKGA